MPTISIAGIIPDIFRNKWNSKTFIEIGTKSNKAKGTHLRSNNKTPIKISRAPTTGKTYPVADRELIKELSSKGINGVGIKSNCMNLFNPKKMRISAKIKLRILVKVEFIRRRVR